MQNINYDRVYEQTVRSLTGRPRLLLHACCAPCSSAVLERVCAAFDVTLYYYNPNIAPRAEYDARARELIRLAAALPQARGVQVLTGPYDNDRFEALCRGMEDLPEGGARCMACYRLRLDQTARTAAQLGADYYGTTLSVSPHKNAQALCRIGLETEALASGARFLCADFKKQGGYARSCQLSRQYGLYRQNYCGCRFSLKEAQERDARRGAKEI